MTYVGLGADDADVGEPCPARKLENGLDAFICSGSSNGTNRKDLIAMQ
jgi:hypothetical protein